MPHPNHVEMVMRALDCERFGRGAKRVLAGARRGTQLPPGRLALRFEGF
jgi:hypothetical protein